MRVSPLLYQKMKTKKYDKLSMLGSDKHKHFADGSSFLNKSFSWAFPASFTSDAHALLL